MSCNTSSVNIPKRHNNHQKLYYNSENLTVIIITNHDILIHATVPSTFKARSILSIILSARDCSTNNPKPPLEPGGVSSKLKCAQTKLRVRKLLVVIHTYLTITASFINPFLHNMLSQNWQAIPRESFCT